MSCGDCVVHHVLSNEFLNELETHPDETNLPLAGSIELTLHCNLRCKHCYIRYPGAADNEMDTAQIKTVLDKLAEAGVLFLLMTGGDILVRPDFKEIYLHAKNLGFLVSLYTNATLVTPELADFLALYPPRRIEITIYGHTPETYNDVTHKPFAFENFREGVRLLLDRKLKVHLKTMVLKSNLHEFEDIRRWAEDELGVPFRFDAIVNPRLNGDHDVLAERIAPEDVVRLQYSDPDEIARFARLRDLAANASSTNGKLFKCGAGIKTVHVDPQGRMHPCMMWRATPYNLLTGSIEGWKRHIHELRQSQAPASTQCTSCSNRLACGNCAATSLLETGQAGSNLDYYCSINKAREKLLDFRNLDLTPESKMTTFAV
ncbi:MAG TPA: radical SAM protein [Kiritimatiellia bacterium]|mgnify:CR=1 FL=1|nr:radical SAM protein [Kiritimatiellia bacterium]